MNVEVRKVETEILETGVGQSNRIDVTYELGADFDGAWVPFASVPQAKVDAAVAAAQSAPSPSPAPQTPDSPAPAEESSSGEATTEPGESSEAPSEAPQA